MNISPNFSESPSNLPNCIADRDATQLLQSICESDDGAIERLFESVYDELRRAATQLMIDENPSHTLQPTALVHEAFLKLRQTDAFLHATDQQHVVRVAVTAMRRLLIDYARRRKAQKRCGDLRRVPLEAIVCVCEDQNLDAEMLGESIETLSDVHDRASQVVTLRFLCGFGVREVARQLDVSISTVEADFRFARAWLRADLSH